MILTKTQVKMLAAFFRKNEVKLNRVVIVESATSGIGSNMYARYVDMDGTEGELDISAYEEW